MPPSLTESRPFASNMLLTMLPLGHHVPILDHSVRQIGLRSKASHQVPAGRWLHR